MARPRYPRSEGPLPPPLPPESRTVGQLVAETVRLYGGRFWPSLALGVGPAAVGVLAAELHGVARAAVVAGPGTVVWGASLVAAVRIAAPGPATRARTGTAFAAALVAVVPFVAGRLVVLPGIDLFAITWFAFLVFSVPAVLVEGRGLGGALRRSVELARADFAHALGSLATLVITIFLSGLVLVALLQGFSDVAIRVASFLALLVLAPLFLLGAALLYHDQAARAIRSGTRPRKRRRDADLPALVPAEHPGGADAEVEPRPAARGQPRRRGARR